MASSKMKLFKISLLILGVSGSVFFVPWTLLKLRLSPLPETVQEQVKEAINYDLDGIIVYIDRGAKGGQSYAAGWQNRAEKTPAHADYYFKIASVSKLYIATATARLAHQQKLSLDETLLNYLPDIGERIENADRITLRMLVQHRSGIPNLIDHPDFPWTDLPQNLKLYYPLIYDQPANFEPNAKYEYSNTNYLLLGQILDRTLGYPHQQYIREELLKPIGLNHTFGSMLQVPKDSLMGGYFVGYEPDIKGNNFIIPGGSMVAQIEDVACFIKALNKGTLLNPEEQKLYESLYPLEHTGELPGYLSIARYHKDLDAVVVQFVNTSGGKTWSVHEAVYQRILKILRKSKSN